MALPERDPQTGRFIKRTELHIVPPPEPEPPRFGNWPAHADVPEVVRVPALPWWKRLLVRLGFVVRVTTRP